VKYVPLLVLIGEPKYNLEKSKSNVGSIIFSILLNLKKNNNYITRTKLIIFLFTFINMSNSFLTQCINILKTDDVRNEIKNIFSPVTDLILYQIYPYIYMIIFLVFLIFIFILAILIILIILLRNKHSSFQMITNY
jgi:hypothetical protein